MKGTAAFFSSYPIANEVFTNIASTITKVTDERTSMASNISNTEVKDLYTFSLSFTPTSSATDPHIERTKRIENT